MKAHLESTNTQTMIEKIFDSTWFLVAALQPLSRAASIGGTTGLRLPNSCLPRRISDGDRSWALDGNGQAGHLRAAAGAGCRDLVAHRSARTLIASGLTKFANRSWVAVAAGPPKARERWERLLQRRRPAALAGPDSGVETRAGGPGPMTKQDTESADLYQLATDLLNEINDAEIGPEQYSLVKRTLDRADRLAQEGKVGRGSGTLAECRGPLFAVTRTRRCLWIGRRRGCKRVRTCFPRLTLPPFPSVRWDAVIVAYVFAAIQVFSNLGESTLKRTQFGSDSVLSAAMAAVSFGEDKPASEFVPIFTERNDGWHGESTMDPRKLAAMSEADRNAEMPSGREDAKAHWTVDERELVNGRAWRLPDTDGKYGRL